MADKPEFVDMIGEATRQLQAFPRRASSILRPPKSRKRRVLVTGPSAAWSRREETFTPREDQALEFQEKIGAEPAIGIRTLRQDRISSSVLPKKKTWMAGRRVRPCHRKNLDRAREVENAFRSLLGLTNSGR